MCVAVDQFQSGQVVADQLQCGEVLPCGDAPARTALLHLKRGRLPHQLRRQQPRRPVLQRLRPRPQDVDVGVVLDVENPAYGQNLRNVCVAQHAQRRNEAAALIVIGNQPRLAQRDDKLTRLYRVDDYLGMSGDDELRTVPSCSAPQFVVDGILQDHVQVRVWFVQQHHGAVPDVEKGQQHQHLLESAARARNVERRPLFGHLIFGANVRAGGVGRQQPIPEQLADGCLQRFPRLLVAAGLGEKVAQHFPRPS